MKHGADTEFLKDYEYVILTFIFGAMTLISLLVPIANAANENMTITSDTSFVTVGISKDVTFTVTRPCGSEPGEACAAVYPLEPIPATDVKVTLTGSASGSDITDDKGKVTFSVNATSVGVVVATASRKGYNDAMISIPSLPNGILTPTPTPTPNSTPTPTPTPNSTPTPTPTPNSTPTPTPTPNSTCTNDVYPAQTYSSYVGDSTAFGTGNLSSTGKTWLVKWYFNGTEVSNESNVTTVSTYTNNGSTIGTWNITSKATSNCSSKTWTIVWTISQRQAPSSGGGGSSSSGSSGGSSGGGGGGATSLESFYNIEKSLSKDNNLIGGSSIAYTLPGFVIYEVDVTGSSNEDDITVKIEHLKNISSTADKNPAGTIYAYENLWINSKRVTSAHVKFKVANSWLNSNNLNKEDIKLLKYTGNWWKLSTKMINNDTNYTYYDALTSGQSVYAISNLKDIVQLAGSQNSTLESASIKSPSNETLANSGNKSAELQALATNSNPSSNMTRLIGLATILAVLLVIGGITRKIIIKLRKKE